MTLTIRKARATDAGAFARIMSEPEVFPSLMQLPYGDEERWRQMLGDNSAPGRNDLQLVAERDGEVVATAGLHAAGFAVRRRHAMSLGIAVSQGAQGQGIGTALMAALCDCADRWLGVLRIELGVYADNERAIALYRKFGFEIEGRYRAYALRDGRYADTLAMARLHPDQPLVRLA